MRVGITGWRGFIGSHLKDKLDNPILFDGDLRDLAKVKLFVKECSRIYHIAGKNRDKEGNILANNLIATGNLVLATKLEKVNPEIIFTSSTQTISNPDSEFGLTKLIEEQLITKTDQWCIFIVPNVYGERCKPFYNSVVATFAYQIAHNEKVTVNDASVIKEFIYIDDLVDYLLNPRFNAFIYPKGAVMTIRMVYEFLTSKLGEHEKLKRCLDYYKEN